MGYPQFNISKLIEYKPYTTNRAELEAVITAIEFYINKESTMLIPHDINELIIKTNNLLQMSDDNNQDLIIKLDELKRICNIPIIIIHINNINIEPTYRLSQEWVNWEGINIASMLAIDPIKKIITTPPISANSLIIYARSSCHFKAKSNIKIGIGIYFPKYPQFNISKFMERAPYTSNRAELEAIEIYMINKDNESINTIDQLVIKTNNKLIHNSYTSWIEKWKENNWIKKKNKQPVLNQDLLKKLDVLKYTCGIPVITEFINGNKEPLDKTSQEWIDWKGLDIAYKLSQMQQ